LTSLPNPLGFAPVRLADGTAVPGFVATGPIPPDAPDVTDHGGWRAYLAQVDGMRDI
ncbi:allophanate hydrolase-related protein, partial [Actinospica acidithermotolerans]|uniref:allophanate hydrolase-related protein n=1 Tax=Actinospica acidithermotolerans TaxID=2828514 RepID=UPI003556FB93